MLLIQWMLRLKCSRCITRKRFRLVVMCRVSSWVSKLNFSSTCFISSSVSWRQILTSKLTVRYVGQNEYLHVDSLTLIKRFCFTVKFKSLEPLVLSLCYCLYKGLLLLSLKMLLTINEYCQCPCHSPSYPWIASRIEDGAGMGLFWQWVGKCIDKEIVLCQIVAFAYKSSPKVVELIFACTTDYTCHVVDFINRNLR